MPPVGMPLKRELEAFSVENKGDEISCRSLSAFSAASESFREVSLAKRIVREIGCGGLLGVLFDFFCAQEDCLFILLSILCMHV